ncbi:EamA family transporter [Pseudomonas anguilliseptica]|uniref:Probable blue pigment (Indigoidine) exporter n=1 Tax=Pseudomonas anguilliseptica TaxID=53406 RepID=A0A1H4QRP6_PSEAG|nr:EamA family transporter [Pseudomonas anguilliseptica]SEC22161.1 probable blue pigment (indigoidine) exporter [Pseudomonas anguilliseptica]
MLRTPWFNTLLTALAPLIWGSTYIVTTEWLPPDRPFVAAMLRALPAGLLLVLCCRQLPTRSDWGRMLVLAALNIGCFQALLFVAAYRLPGGLAAVVGAVQPLLLMGLLWGLEGRRPAQVTIGASLLGVAGMAALLLSPDSRWDTLGIVAAFAGMSCMALGTYLTRRWKSDLALLPFTGWQLLLGGLMLLPLAVLVDPPLQSLSISQGLAYAYLSLFGALLAYVLWFRGIARLSPVAVSSLSLLSPVVAVLIGWLLLDERITGVALIGLLTVLGSILAVQWTSNAPKASSQPKDSSLSNPV